MVRETIDRWEIEASEEILLYFLRFGSWEDVERILKLKEKVDGGYPFLGTGRSRHDKMVGNALFRIGAIRIIDLLHKIQSHKIKAGVIGVCSQRAIAGLGDETILVLMNDDNDLVRKVTVLRCLEVLPKSRLDRLLNAYVNREEFRYYNVIHWLDLGVSMPKRFSKRIVEKELEGV